MELTNLKLESEKQELGKKHADTKQELLNAMREENRLTMVDQEIEIVGSIAIDNDWRQTPDES